MAPSYYTLHQLYVYEVAMYMLVYKERVQFPPVINFLHSVYEYH